MSTLQGRPRLDMWRRTQCANGSRQATLASSSKTKQGQQHTSCLSGRELSNAILWGQETFGSSVSWLPLWIPRHVKSCYELISTIQRFKIEKAFYPLPDAWLSPSPKVYYTPTMCRPSTRPGIQQWTDNTQSICSRIFSMFESFLNNAELNGRTTINK